MKPYFDDGIVTLYHAKCEDIPSIWSYADVLVSDVPYGIDYNSGARRESLPASIAGDKDTSLRDYAILTHQRSSPGGMDAPALIFGSWRVPRPAGTRQLLVWDTKGALGMGALDLPWKPAHQEIYVLGKGFQGRRTSDVLTHAPVQATARNGRRHPHEKPVPLMEDLLSKCPAGIVADPFSGSGSTLVAAQRLGIRAIGVEIEERYCEIAAQRLSQQPLDLFGGDA